MRGHDTCGIRATISIDVLNGFVGAVLVERAVIMMVMRLLLKMEYNMFDAFAVILHETSGRSGERMPQQRDYEQENGGCFMHRANLTETHHCVEPLTRNLPV